MNDEMDEKNLQIDISFASFMCSNISGFFLQGVEMCKCTAFQTQYIMILWYYFIIIII